MAHELDRNSATGSAAMFSVRQTPWHNEGVLLTEAPSLEQAMILAGCNYEVGLRPLFVNEGGAEGQAGDGSTGANMQVFGGTTTRTPMGKAVVRLDRGTVLADDVLAIVGDGYRPLQNRDAFAVLEPLLDKGVAHLETGGTLRGGKDAWMLIRFDIDDPVVKEVFAKEIVPFGLVTNNHTAEARALVMQTPIRVVCANTLGSALVGWKDRADVIAVSHRGDARVRLVEAAEKLFGGIVERYRTIAEHYRNMKATILTVDQFIEHVLDNASALPPDPHTPGAEHFTSKGYDIALAAAEKRRAEITTKWTEGAGHTGDHSAWEAYNGAVEVIDHDASLFRVRGSRVSSMIGGRLLAKKERVLNSLAKLASR